MNITIQDRDTVIENNAHFVKELRNITGYPFNLTEDQIVRIIYFFGSRRCSAKAAARTLDRSKVKDKEHKFALGEIEALKEFFHWFGYITDTNAKWFAAYKSFISRFKKTLDFLREHPAYVTKNIYQALETAGYKKILQSIILVADEHGQVQTRTAEEGSGKQPIPLGKIESLIWDIQNITVDKIYALIQAITPKDMQKANLGSKSKAARDLMAMLHMIRQGSKNPNLTLTQINIGSSDSKEKLSAFHAYTQRNREIGT